jgi:outer membrane protein OmpA-like peptidoglycan-associated protein
MMSSCQRFFILILCIVLFPLWLNGQSLRSFEKAGDAAFKNKDYGAAMQHFGTILKKKEKDWNLWWKYGESARQIFALVEAEKAYQKILNAGLKQQKFPLLFLHFGDVKRSKGDYEAAIGFYKKYIATNPAPAELEATNAAIAACTAALMISSSTHQVEIKHLGKEINSPFSEFAPFVVGDTLFFSSYRFDKKSDKIRPKSKLTKVMLSARGGRAREPGRGFPSTDTAHIAHTAFSPDGHYVFFTICKNINANDIRCELWLTVIDRRNRWLPPLRLPEPINLPGTTTTQPNIGYDEYAQGPVLWFASDRKGGKGGLDIYSVPLDTVFFCSCNLPLPGKKIPRPPSFKDPVNATEINTAVNDGTPFFHAPTQKLYFSSQGWQGLGSYDLFASTKKGDSLSAPQNLGPGINTSYNDLYLFLKRDGLSGYLSSNRPGSFYLDEANKSCCNDLFSFTLPPPPAPPKTNPDSLASLEAIKPPIPEKQPLPPPVLAPKIQDFVGLPLYFDNDEPDKRTNRTSTRKNYQETVEAYLERQGEYKERFSVGLKGTRLDEAETAIDDFFDNEVRKGYDRLGQLADLLLERLQRGESVEVIIKGFTSPRAKSDYNLNLGKRRISSVRNYFETFGDGIFRSYIQSGKCVISEVSFGETTVRSGVVDAINDERNSIFHPDAARERRVEIVEIRTKE